jgi:hypothetical protein
MAPTLTAKISVAVQAEYRNAADLGTAVDAIDVQKVIRLTSGTGPGQADRCSQSRRTLNASASETLDLSGGLTDEFGNLLTLTKIKGLYIRTADTNVNDVVIGGTGTNGWTGPFGAATHTLAVPPGALQSFTHPVGWPVTAGTVDLFKITNGGAGSAVACDVVIFGTSA